MVLAPPGKWQRDRPVKGTISHGSSTLREAAFHARVESERLNYCLVENLETRKDLSFEQRVFSLRRETHLVPLRVRAGCLKSTPETDATVQRFYLHFDPICRDLSPMKTSANRSQTPDNAAARKGASATRSTPEKADWHWADQQLDDELRDTFPASDALSIVRNPGGK
jgi:hypothetical protein